MADKSKIEWTDATWNPIRGTAGRWHCTKASEACTNCYAERMNVRFGGPKYVSGADELRLDENVLEQPLRWKRPRRIFPCSMTDLFHEDVPEEWWERIWTVMYKAEQHTFQVLTKRADRLREWVASSLWLLNDPPQNVWLGVTAENQQRAEERIPSLLECPAPVRFVSIEPMLGPVDLEQWLGYNSPGDGEYCPADRIQWVIVGGESGPGARPTAPNWVRLVRDQCADAGVAFFFKQWGKQLGPGATLDGEKWKEFPEPITDPAT